MNGWMNKKMNGGIEGINRQMDVQYRYMDR